jgi:hypothetical protein
MSSILSGRRTWKATSTASGRATSSSILSLRH